MQGHAASNIIPVAAANRTGTERVEPSQENGGQKSEISFYGSSFITGSTGEILAQAGRDSEEMITAEFDFAKIRQERLEWGMFRDRRPECYTQLVK